jgi:hypothetical protein
VRKQREAIHHRHVDVEQEQLDLGIGFEHLECFLAMTGEGEAELATADFTPESLGEQRLEIRLVIYGEDFCRSHQSAAAGN